MDKGRLSFLVILICRIEISLCQKITFKCYKQSDVDVQCDSGKTIQILNAKWTHIGSAHPCPSDPSLCKVYPLNATNTCHGQQSCTLTDVYACSYCTNTVNNCAVLTYRCEDCNVESCSSVYTPTTPRPPSSTTTSTASPPITPTQSGVNTVITEETSNANSILSMELTSMTTIRPNENTSDITLGSENVIETPESKGLAIGPILGGVIGGAFLIIIVIILTICLVKRRKSISSSNGTQKLNNMQNKNTNGQMTDLTDPMDTYDEAIPVNNRKGFGKKATEVHGNNIESVDQTYDEAIPNYQSGNEPNGIKNDTKAPYGETLYSDVNESKGDNKKLKKINNKESSENIDDGDNDDEPLEMYAVVAKKPSETKTEGVPSPTVKDDSDSDQEPPPAPPKLNTDLSTDLYENT